MFRDVLAAEEPARVLLLEPGQATVRGARPPAGQPPDPLQRGLPPRDPGRVGLAAHFENPDQLLPVGGQMAPREVVADGADRNTGQAADVPDPQSGAFPERRQLPREIRLRFDLFGHLLRRGRIISHWSP